mgnify:CR=1 FL=1|jgi:prepilin-type N-terminal cleavage/methylation domain-containing protein
MNNRGFSLVEVLLAAGILAIGLTAAAVLASTLMAQEELNAASLRAANQQEQAVQLYRLDLAPASILGILPENCVGNQTPPPNGFSLVFGRSVPTTLEVEGTLIALDLTVCNLVFANPSGGESINNGVKILRPQTRVKYQQ